MNKTKIDWADVSWNPVTGCQHDCPYCYAKRIAERFGGYTDFKREGAALQIKTCGIGELDEPMSITRSDGRKYHAAYPFGFEPTLHRYRLSEPTKEDTPRNVFVCSMADLFGKWVPTRWIIEVLDACQAAPQHNYIFLTKNPQRYIDLDQIALLPREKNFWYGTTTTNAGEPYFSSDNHNTFVCIEPIMEPVCPDEEGFRANWVIVGAETGKRKEKIVPQREWLEDLREVCVREDVPLFMKSNLTDVWGEDLVQEYPTELLRS